MGGGPWRSSQPMSLGSVTLPPEDMLSADHVVVCRCSGAPTGAHLWGLTTHPAARVWIAEGGSMNRHIRLAAFVTLAACSSTKKGPVLTSLSPATGTVGTVVTIDGTGFAQNGTTNPKVTFVPVAGGNSTDAVVQAFSATALDVKVPDVGALAAAGTAFDVKVTNPDGGATTLKGVFTMTAPL